MKRVLAALVFFVLPLAVQAQQMRITLNISPSPSPYLSDWTTRRETVILTIVNSDTKEIEVRLGAKISAGGALQAETNIEKVPVFTVRPGVNTFYGEDLVPAEAVKFIGSVDKQVVRTGKLPSGSYQFCLRVYAADTRAPLSEDQCRQFSIRSYKGPDLLYPRPMVKIPPPYIRQTLRWTPVAPQYSPRQQYEITVMEVLAGQTPTVAFRANRPILERTVMAATQLIWPSDVRLDTPMAYVWSVRAIDDAGNPLGDTKDGWAEPWSFTLGGVAAAGPPGLVSPGNGVKIPPADFSGLQWVPLSPETSAGQQYEVRMVAVNEGETPEQAFRVNRPILERRIRGVRINPGSVHIDTPMTYVWSVRALDDAGSPLVEGEGGWAEPWSFTIGAGGAGSVPAGYGELPGPLETIGSGGSGHTRGLRVTLNVSSHPSPYLSDWRTKEMLKITVDNESSTGESVDIRIEAGDRLATPDAGLPWSRIVTVPPGRSTFHGEDLVPAGSATPPAGGDSMRTVVRSGRLPSGAYQICAGLYDPRTGEKISDSDCGSITIDDGVSDAIVSLRSEGVQTLMFVSSATDCGSVGRGCVEIFPEDHPSDRWLAAMKKDRATTLRNTYRGRAKVHRDSKGETDRTAKPLDPDTLPGMTSADPADSGPAPAADVYGRPIDEGRAAGFDDTARKLAFELTAIPGLPDSSIVLDTYVDLSSELCRLLGIDSARIPTGNYPLVRSMGTNGGVDFPVRIRDARDPDDTAAGRANRPILSRDRSITDRPVEPVRSIRVTLNINAHPDPYLANWPTSAELPTLTIVNSDSKELEVRLGTKISSSGTLQAETRLDRMPILRLRPGLNTFHGEDLVPARAMTFPGGSDSAGTVIRSGRLPSGNYRICTTLYDARSNVPIIDTTCGAFTIGTPGGDTSR